MSSGLRSSLGPEINSHSESACDICYLHFNKSSRIPLIICQSRHQMCSHCLQAIRKSKRCPFCRHPLDLSNIRINKELVRKLTDNPQQPNIRHEILQQQSNFYISAVSSELPQPDINQEIFLQIQNEQQYRLQYMIQDTQKKRKTMYILTALLVLPFFLFDFYFGFLDGYQPQCTMNRKLLGLINLRSWFIIISFLQASYLMLFLIGLIIRKCRSRQYDAITLNALEEIYVQGIIFKAFICCFVELSLFFGVMVSSCSGTIYAYGIVLAITHMLKVLITTMAILKHGCC